jgi:hypothetical protein
MFYCLTTRSVYFLFVWLFVLDTCSYWLIKEPFTNNRNIAIEETFDKGLIETILHLAFWKCNEFQQDNECHYRQRGRGDLDTGHINMNNFLVNAFAQLQVAENKQWQPFPRMMGLVLLDLIESFLGQELHFVNRNNTPLGILKVQRVSARQWMPLQTTWAGWSRYRTY